MSTDTGKAKLPALPPVNANDPALRTWMNAVAERLEVREGSRGNPAERVVTQREFAAIQKLVSEMSTVTKAGPDDVALSLGNGLTAVIPVAQFANAILRTRLWKDLQYSLDDPRRFDYLSSELRALVEKNIAEEAAARGADIKRTDIKIQDLDRSLAATVTEITAALRNNSSGIRELTAAYVSATSATAVKVTQLSSSLGNYYQDGTPGRANLEQTLLTQAEYTTGLRSQYTLKLSAGGAIAGFGISATEYNGVPDSAFIIQANKFAIVAPDYTGGMTSSPATNLVPFGVDANGVYINGQVRINTGGSTLSTLATNAATPSVNYIGAFSTAPSTTNLKKNSVYRNTTDGNSYILSADGGTWGLFLEKGAAGSPGDAGVRGSVDLYASGSAWSDTTANNAVLSFTGSSTKVIGDTVTISNGTSFAATRYWSGTAWVSPGVVIDGNLLVNGTISGSKIAGTTITGDKIAGNTITADKINGTNLNVVNGTFSGSLSAATGTFNGLLSAAKVQIGSTDFIDPNQPTLPLFAVASGFLAYTGDTGVSTVVTETCYDTKTGGAYDCSYTVVAGAPVTSTSLLFTTNNSATDISLRIKTGAVRFLVTAAGTVDHYFSIWYRYKNANGTFGAWNPVAMATEPQSSYGASSCSVTGVVGVSLGQGIQFGFAATDTAGNYWNTGARSIIDGSISVLAFNF